MILRIAFFALMAVGLIGFGGIAWVVLKPPAAAHVAAAPPTKTTVLTAAHAIRAGSLLKPEDIAAKEMPSNELSPDASADTQDARRSLAGAMVRHSLGAGEPIRASDVMRPGDHGFLAAVLGPGMRAMTVAVDAVTGSAGLIWPGDRVDLILTQTISEASQPIGRRVAAETVLSDVRVIAIDQQLMQGADANSGGAIAQARTVTLEVTQEQAERVLVAVRLGKLSLSVRSAEAPPAGTPVAAERNTTWASDVSPALGRDESPRTTHDTIRVFPGSADAKEFKF